MLLRSQVLVQVAKPFEMPFAFWYWTYICMGEVAPSVFRRHHFKDLLDTWISPHNEYVVFLVFRFHLSYAIRVDTVCYLVIFIPPDDCLGDPFKTLIFQVMGDS